jgi:hypothetical protein
LKAQLQSRLDRGKRTKNSRKVILKLSSETFVFQFPHDSDIFPVDFMLDRFPKKSRFRVIPMEKKIEDDEH